MTDMREQHFNEPVMDRIDPRLLLSDEKVVTHLDLNKASPKDLDFIAKFSIKVADNGELNGLVLWFKVWFSKSHLEASIDGSPYSEKPVFSQLILYLKNKTSVKKGDSLWGSIAVKHKVEDEYKTDIKLSVNLEDKEFNNVQYYTLK